LGVAGVLQTVPSLALLALMVPLLGGTIGFLPAFLAMTAYSFLPILANTVIGIRGVDSALIEAARGLGMTARQMLFRVQLPLAAPVILAGVRTATVVAVGTATLATPVGETTLGNYIFAGLSTRDHLTTVFGCVFAALLAVVLDQLIRLLEVAARRRSRRLAWAGALGLLAILCVGLYRPARRLVDPPPNPVVVGNSDYTEQHILGEALKGRLEEKGFSVDQRKGMVEMLAFTALCSGQIDCYVAYTGNIWATEMKRHEPASPETTLRGVSDWLLERHGVVCLGRLGFENAYALAMPRQRAADLGIRTLADLKTHAPRFRLAGDLSFFRRPEWARVREKYGLAFGELRAMESTLMYSALSSGTVDVICAYTSDGRIPADNLVVLEDPLRAFPPYDAVILLSPRAARKPGLRDALTPLLGSIDIEKMREANRQVDLDRLRPRQAAAQLLASLRPLHGKGP
jgi:osmoprotectant transport system permease protein